MRRRRSESERCRFWARDLFRLPVIRVIQAHNVPKHLTGRCAATALVNRSSAVTICTVLQPVLRVPHKGCHIHYDYVSTLFLTLSAVNRQKKMSVKSSWPSGFSHTSSMALIPWARHSEE